MVFAYPFNTLASRKIFKYPSNVNFPTGSHAIPSCAINSRPSDREDIRTCHIGITEQNAIRIQKITTITCAILSPTLGFSTIEGVVSSSILLCFIFILNNHAFLHNLFIYHNSFFLKAAYSCSFENSEMFPDQNRDDSVTFLLRAFEPNSNTVPTTDWNRPDAADRL